MPGPGVIDAYLQALRRHLPDELADELADGLTETYEQFLREGLPPSEAAQAAVRDFGTPAQIATAFRRNAPGHRLASRLLMTGPVVGGCWAAVLLTDPLWHAVPPAVRLLLPLLLVSVIALLAIAWRGPYNRIRPAARTAGFGLIAVDAAAVAMVVSTGSVLSPLLVLAVCASLARITFTGRTLTTVGRGG